MSGTENGQAADEPPAARVPAVSGTGIPIRGNDIDTDQIIPSRFMKVVTFEGLGQYAFYDQRIEEDPHPLEDDRFRTASIMAVNANFGTGSSREHAPQALMRWGIEGLIGESFAEIFRGNCLALGLPTVTTDSETVTEIQDWIEANPDEDIEIDVEDATVSYGDTTIDVEIDDSQQRALTEGTWDTTAVMKANFERVRDRAQSLPYIEDAEIPEQR
ncbi:3-isopropylmalate dehydratase small subunit [Halodesulfurarchaeum sp.]|uniref:3-isopropylmalate dehydratase small subunit n=1 Tax=Halodesulfurarchaeum sp. TaxID=1980530 RepID=UPI001BBBB4D1|nr:3-isopropylmalate dehydratase small subunit [Halodesulfurarchaeum sp.]